MQLRDLKKERLLTAFVLYHLKLVKEYIFGPGDEFYLSIGGIISTNRR